MGVYDYLSREPKNDPDYVRWQPYLVEDIGGPADIYKPLKFHTCTEEDFSQFYTVANRSEKRLQELKRSNALICLDSEEL